MPPPPVPSEEDSDAYTASHQPTCSSSSSGITCAHIEVNSDDLDGDDASLDKEMEASDSMTSAWTDSKHSSYLNLMEQRFVRDLYEGEYCALDVCGQLSQRQHRVDEAHDPDSAESCFPVPFGPLEFKVWENGNWTWRPDSKRKGNPLTLLSNPWFKHFRTRASCGTAMSNPTSRPQNGQDETQIAHSHDFNIPDANQGSTGMEFSSSVAGREGDYNEPEAEHCIQQVFIHEESKSRKRTTAQLDSEQGLSMRRRAFCLDKKIGIFSEVCVRRDEEDDHYSLYSCMPHCGDG